MRRLRSDLGVFTAVGVFDLVQGRQTYLENDAKSGDVQMLANGGVCLWVRAMKGACGEGAWQWGVW